MAETSPSMIAQALERAITATDGMPLYAGKQAPGLFANNAAGKQAAAEARAAGLIQVLRGETKGKTTVELCTLTEKGLSYLLDQSSPRPILEALLEAIHNCETKIDSWIAGVQESRRSLDGLRALADKVLTHLKKPETTLPSWARNGHAHEPETKIIDALQAWHASGKLGDCPLPNLFEQLQATSPKLTLGQYHDALRALHDRQAVYLHPWTGPLHELPRPPFSLLVGHEIAYYASLRE